ncbi:MAG TPA: hypothetical protein VNL91_04205 [Thermoanaerobaculia bacterium]|nr:hypothetical protein [Thermoanaerobaculia bacterium]
MAIWHTLTGRTERRVREIAKAVLEESKTDVRLSTIEVTLPRIESSIADVKDAVTTTNEKLDTLLLSGRIPIKKD